MDRVDLAVRCSHNSVVALLLNTPNIDVNLKINKRGWCALREAVRSKNNEALKLLLDLPTIDTMSIVDDYDDLGGAVYRAVKDNNNEGLKLLLNNVQNIGVNIVADGRNAVHWAVVNNNMEVLNLLLSHPSLTAFTLNQRENMFGATPVMWATMYDRLEALALLAADLRVDLSIPNKWESLEERARWDFLLHTC